MDISQNHSGDGDNIGRDKIILPPHKTPQILTKTTGIINKSNFVGRVKEFEKIEEFLNKSDTLLLINGIGGIGKSSLASYYLSEKKNEFDYYGYVQVNEDIKLSFATIFKTSLDLKQEKIDDLFNEAINKLQNLKGKKLLIIDDVKEINSQKEEIETIINLANSGFKILFTSRSKIPNIQNYILDTLSIDEARELFLLYHKTIEIEKIDKILEYIGSHTLFIELISKTIESEGYELDFILEKFEKGELCKIEFIDEEGLEKTLNKNLQILFDLQNLSDEYILLLKKLSILPSIEIEFEFLEKILEGVKKGKLNFLVNCGWLIKNGESYKFHQIIKEYILKNYTPKFEEIEKQIDFFNKLIENSEDTYIAISLKNNLIFFESIIKIIDNLKMKNEKIFILYVKLGYIFYHLHKYEKALFIFKKSIKVTEEIFAEKNAYYIAISYGMIARLLLLKGEYSNALQFVKKSIKINEDIFGEEHSKTAFDYANLAEIYRLLGEYGQSLTLFDKSIKINKNIYGEEHRIIAENYNNLAVLYISMEEYEKAISILEKTISISKKTYGEKHPSTILHYSNLSAIYIETKNYKKAMSILKKTINLNEEILGTEHINTALDYGHLARIYYLINKYEKASYYIKKTINILEKILPKEHSYIIFSKNLQFNITMRLNNKRLL